MNTQLIKEKQDMTYLSWPFFRPSPGTVGSFLKAYSELGGKKVYYKLSNFDKTEKSLIWLIKVELSNPSQ